MKYKMLSDALNEISDAHIAEAAAPRKRTRLPWLGAVAALLAAALLVTTLSRPATVQAEGLVAAPEYPSLAPYDESDWAAWREDQLAQYDQPEGYARGTEVFFQTLTAKLLDSGEENVACSPLNIYMALAMLTEVTDHESRAQLLALLGAADLETLREQASHIWNAHYRNDGLNTTVLANSLWLDSRFSYNEATADTLAASYYASVYREDLGTKEADHALRQWLNAQTGGLLKEQAQELSLDPDCIMALASTIFYQVQWADEFNAVNNYTGTFHAPSGDMDATYLYQNMTDSAYYTGDTFTGTYRQLKDNSKMWLILPAEGYSPGDVLADPQLSEIFENEDYAGKSYPWIHLSLPKFDISASMDLIHTLQELGVRDIFDSSVSDFTPIFPEGENIFIKQIAHAARVAADEKGVTAAAYTVIEADAAAADIEEEVDLILDRPFLFFIESRDGLPLFAGVVNTP